MKKAILIIVIISLFGCNENQQQGASSFQAVTEQQLPIDLSDGYRNDDVPPNTWTFLRSFDIDGMGTKVGWYRNDKRLGDTIRFPVSLPLGSEITGIYVYWYQGRGATFDMHLMLARSLHGIPESLDALVADKYGELYETRDYVSIPVEEGYVYYLELLGIGDWDKLQTFVVEIVVFYE